MYSRQPSTIKLRTLDHSLHTLSYGMRQKVAIASAQAIEPEIYVMDEPSANLDIESTYASGYYPQSEGTGKNHCNRRAPLVLSHGCCGPIFLYSARCDCARVLKGRNEEPPIGQKCIRLACGRRTSIKWRFSRCIGATDEVVLETQGLHKAFDGTVVLNTWILSATEEKSSVSSGRTAQGKVHLGASLPAF